MANTSGKSFGSDNHAGVHPAVMAAVSAANSGDAVAYGDDDITRTAIAQLCEATGAQSAYLVFTGTAANILGISLMIRSYEAVICAESSHLNVDECGAAERVLGCKLLPVPTSDGKLTPGLIATRMTGLGDEHRVQPRVIQLAQASELGTCYSLEELRELQAFAQDHGLLTYIDGARIANAAAHLGCGLAEIAAYADVLSFGGTKNGAIGVEAVLVMTDGLADGARYHRKQQMQLASKMRFLGAQASALLADELWLTSASHANAMAARLASALAVVPGVRLAYPVQANSVFTEVDGRIALQLEKDFNIHVWSESEDGSCIVRWMTAFDTSAADVDTLAEAVEASIVSRET